jgi:folate-binding Fe-S cluster repair protein YgfZ
MGQELTARSRYVGQIRKRTFPIIFKVPGEYIVGEKLMVDDREVGELRATNGTFGLAMLKLEALPFEIVINGHSVRVSKSSWMQLPE